jgi:hypothetical protein
MHVYKAWHFSTPTQFYPKLGPKVKPEFYYKTGYTRYIPGIYYTYTMQKSGSSLLSCPSALGSLRQGLPSDLLSFGHREVAHARLGQSKVPQPGVDVINMAAPPRIRPAPLAQQHSKASFCWLLYLCGIVEVAFPSRKHGMRGTLPRRSSTLLM